MNLFSVYRNWDWLKQRWFAVSMVHITLLVNLIIYWLSPDVGQSRAFLGLAVVITVWTLMIFGITTLINESWREQITKRTTFWLRGGVILLGLLALVGFGMFMRPELIYFHIGITLTLDLALVILVFFRQSEITAISLPIVWIILVVLLLIAMIRILTLAYVPAMQVNDEGWLLAWAISLLEDGTFSDRLMYFGGHDVHGYYYGMAAWFALVGSGFYQGRLYSLIVIAMTIILTSATADRLFNNRRIALLTALFMSLSEVVLIGARVRHDAGLAFSIALSLYFYVLALRTNSTATKRFILYVVAGMAMGLGLLSHYHVVGFSIAMGLGLFIPIYIKHLERGEWIPSS